MAQPAEAPATARQFASWLQGSQGYVVAFERYAIATFWGLRDSGAVCPPVGRSVEANDLAAVEAAKTGVHEGLFEDDSPAVGPLTETFSFWFPCRS